MIGKVFLDSNVILDVLLSRNGKEAAGAVLQAGCGGAVQLCTSVLSFANIAYVLRKYFSGEELRGMLRSITANLSILPMGDQIVYESLNVWGPDYEDVLQYVCADYSRCDCIVTSDVKHYTGSAIPVYTPSQFIGK